MKNHPAKRLGILVGLLIAAGLVWWASMPDKSNLPRGDNKEESPFGEMDDFIYTRTMNGQIQWQVRAAQAQYFTAANEARFNQVDALLWENGRRIEIKGERANVDVQSRQGRMEGDVYGETDDGMVFRTARLDFTADPRRATTDQAVLLTGPFFSVKGVGMDLDLDEQKIRLKQNVEADWWAASKP